MIGVTQETKYRSVTRASPNEAHVCITRYGSFRFEEGCVYLFFTKFWIESHNNHYRCFLPFFFQVLSAKQVEEQIKATELEQTSFESSIASRWESLAWYFYFFAWDLEAIIDKLSSTRLEMFML